MQKESLRVYLCFLITHLAVTIKISTQTFARNYPPIHSTVKGAVHRFYMGGPRDRLQLRNTVYFKRS